MLAFKDLSPGQKNFVVTLMKYYPAIRHEPKISLQQLNYIYKEIAEMRETGGPKIGYPNWIFKFKSAKVGRGVYKLPVPTDAELREYDSGLTVSTVKPIVMRTNTVDDDIQKIKSMITDIYTEEEFNAECRAAGIKV